MRSSSNAGMSLKFTSLSVHAAILKILMKSGQEIFEYSNRPEILFFLNTIYLKNFTIEQLHNKY